MTDRDFSVFVGGFTLGVLISVFAIAFNNEQPKVAIPAAVVMPDPTNVMMIRVDSEGRAFARCE